jgi:4-amino-4-deoxy-L-arabinose transferase-like glycosyltransferase
MAGPDPLNTIPKPALASQRAVARLPRLALLLFCAAYVLPGIFHRDPWKNADVAAFGAMLSIAEGRSAWLAPTLGGVPLDAAPLPYGLGALAIRALGPWMGVELAARLPFALLLVLVLVLSWYTAYYLARTEAAQPVPFAFGGEAHPIDYARAIADGALLALIATLGLLQLGHETTPEMAQLASVALFLYATAAAPFRAAQPRLAMIAALPALAASGAPVIALGLGLAGVVICRSSSYPEVRRFAFSVAASTVLACAVATVIGAWAWRAGAYTGAAQLVGLFRQIAWFTWPAWPLALWTLWRWRRHLGHRHIAVPLGAVAVVLVAWIGMAGADRALLLALPALAALAAFALPTLKRSASAAIDWFSVFFFTACALAIWVIYVSLQTGVPAKPAANVARLAPGFEASFGAVELLVAVLGSVAWLALVRWRTGRNRHPLWKSLVLPAGGVALCWLLLMTLWLPLLDYARSYRPVIDRIAAIVPRDGCVATQGLPLSQVAALEHRRYRVDAVSGAAATRCRWLLAAESASRRSDPGPPWERIGRERRPTDRDDFTAIYRRAD